MFLSLWKRSIYGLTLREIKESPEMVVRWSNELAPFIRRILGENLGSGNWAMVTPPARRHKDMNFAKLVADELSIRLCIPHYGDVAIARNRQRVNAEYGLNMLPEEQNLIIFDDICTTGSTLMSMERLLKPLGKNLTFIVGINNSK